MSGLPVGGGGTALVTGGTSGIGAAFARELASRGHDLVLVARDQHRLDQAAVDLSGRFGITVETLRADLADPAEVATVVDRLTDAARPVDVLVNNAGFGVHHRLTDPDPGPHEHALAVMVHAVLVLGGAAGRSMRERGHGAIVTVSSLAGELTMGGYSAIKAWATAYSESLSTELAGTGVTVTALLPGWVRTEFHQRAEIRVGSIPGFLWMDADALAQDCLDDVVAGRVISLPSLRYQVLGLLLRHLPRRLVRRVSGSISSSRRH